MPLTRVTSQNQQDRMEYINVVPTKHGLVNVFQCFPETHDPFFNMGMCIHGFRMFANGKHSNGTRWVMERHRLPGYSPGMRLKSGLKGGYLDRI